MQDIVKSAAQFLRSALQTIQHRNDKAAEATMSAVAATNRGGRSMIGSGAKIEGKLVSDEDLMIQGQVKGSVTAKANEVIVGVKGKLTADIQAKVVKVEGTVSGDITASEKVIIAKTGNVVGNIRAPRVNLEDGAKFKGSIEMDPEDMALSGLQVKSMPEPKTQPLDIDTKQVG